VQGKKSKEWAAQEQGMASPCRHVSSLLREKEKSVYKVQLTSRKKEEKRD
jgi:hypothetical protein